LTQDIETVVPILNSDDVTFRVTYNSPLPSPLIQGDIVGQMIVDVPGIEPRVIPLAAAQSVERGGFMTRVRTAALKLLALIDQGPEGAF
jgi:D-alanyl-D-alanine carboxypeptidase (penicillin-binding protein 5/6)